MYVMPSIWNRADFAMTALNTEGVLLA